MSDQRLKELYEKYTKQTSTDSELEELFDLLKTEFDLGGMKEVLLRVWNNEEVSEQLNSFQWEDLQKKMLQDQRDLESKRQSRRRFLIRGSAAAGFLLFLSVAAWFWSHREITIVYQTDYGEVKEYVLNDNSIVRLNANSILYWDENWERSGGRKAIVEGEVFFDVTHLHDDQSFRVFTPDLTVKVTGTAFNVTTRSEKTRVYLESGEVYLNLKKNKKIIQSGTFNEMPESIKMSPGELVDYSWITNEVFQEKNVASKKATSWKDGELIFEDVPLRIVLEELSEVYGKDFEVKNQDLLEKKIDVGMPFSDWKTVKGLMELMINVKMTESKGEVVIE